MFVPDTIKFPPLISENSFDENGTLETMDNELTVTFDQQNIISSCQSGSILNFNITGSCSVLVPKNLAMEVCWW